MPEVDLRPETAEEGTCRSCGAPIWWVNTTEGQGMSLDRSPVADGNVEMVRVAGVWRADVLHQVESLFEVGDRLRWRPHVMTCPRTAGRRAIPAQRAR